MSLVSARPPNVNRVPHSSLARPLPPVVILPAGMAPSAAAASLPRTQLGPITLGRRRRASFLGGAGIGAGA
eukprot:2508762-Prymnesium_polylepis.1